MLDNSGKSRIFAASNKFKNKHAMEYRIKIITESGDKLALVPCYDCDNNESFYDVYGENGAYWGELQGAPSYDPDDEDNDSVLEEIKSMVETAIEQGDLAEQLSEIDPYPQTVYMATVIEHTPFGDTVSSDIFASKEGAKSYANEKADEFIGTIVSKSKFPYKKNDNGMEISVKTEPAVYWMKASIILKDIKP